MAELTNAQIAAAFDELGDLYELDGAVQYRVLAYRAAARTVREASVSVIALTRDGRVTELPGIGKTLEEKLKALDETGDIPAAVKLRAKFPAGLLSVMHLPGFGPMRARRLYDELVESVQSAGDAGAGVTLHTGLKVDLKVVEPDQFGNVLQHFTGSKAHNVALRESVVRRGLHVSEYGILDDATGETTRCATEEEVYARLGLEWIPPELREGRGELEAAADGGDGLPDLIALDDLRGDLHSHTTLSDGTATAEEMVAAARERGME